MTAKALRVVLLLVLTATAASAEENATSRGVAAPSSASAGDGASAAPDVAAQANLKTEKHTDDSASPASPAEADKEPVSKPADKEAGEDDTYGHGMQFGIRAGIGFGYKMVFRYARSPLCANYDPTKKPDDQQKICGFGAAPSTEVALSFAPFDGVEPYIFGRFGLSGESKTNTSPLQLYGIGARIYTMSDSRFKFFIEPAVAYETEGWAGNVAWTPPGLNPSYKQDLLFHVGMGPQYDFAKAFGLYLNGAVDVGVLRAISATLMVNVGAQIRFP